MGIKEWELWGPAPITSEETKKRKKKSTESSPVSNDVGRKRRAP